MSTLDMGTIWNDFIIFWVAMCLVSWFVQYKLYKLVKQVNYEKWVWLGKPDIPFMFSDIAANQTNPFSAIAYMYRTMFRIFAFALKQDAELNKNPRIKKLWTIHHYVMLVALISFFGFIAFALIATIVFHID